MGSVVFPAPAFRGEYSRERVSVVALVVALHLAALLAWMAQPETVPAPEREMEVVAIAPAAQPEIPPVPPPPKPAPVLPPRNETPAPKPAPVEPATQSKEAPVEQPDAPPVLASAPHAPPTPVIAPAPVVIAPAHPPPAPVAAAPAVVPSAPVIPDVEPDYKAGYLNNPRPSYPFAARRMGLQGRVVLNVEVLADGLCGQVNVHQSSGHEMLDNAALQTVKTWKFTPARQAGQAVTKWFKVPIQFSLNNNET